MTFLYKYFWGIAAALVMAVSLTLTGCGDTISQSSSGGGSNCSANDGSCSITTQPVPTAEEILGADASGSVDATSEGGQCWYNVYTKCSCESHDAGRC